MTALLGSANRTRKANSWGLIAHTVAMFSVATIPLAIVLFVLSAAYINGREFVDTDGVPLGPLGYLSLPKFYVAGIVTDSGVEVNQWLADGLLVSPTLNSATQVPNVSRFHSCIVATSFMV